MLTHLQTAAYLTIFSKRQLPSLGKYLVNLTLRVQSSDQTSDSSRPHQRGLSFKMPFFSRLFSCFKSDPCPDYESLYGKTDKEVTTMTEKTITEKQTPVIVTVTTKSPERKATRASSKRRRAKKDRRAARDAELRHVINVIAFVEQQESLMVSCKRPYKHHSRS